MLEVSLTLFPVAIFAGWCIAHYGMVRSGRYRNNEFDRRHPFGLNYLLHEQADKAVDTFIKILEVDAETVETHLALGVLFRRRGEIDRAIRLHQNLIARPQLPRAQKTQALLALGQDYYHGGLLDRAERLFTEIAHGDHETGCTKIALSYLLDIYQQQKRWDVAIEEAKKISRWEPIIARNLAHYYCELALKQLKNHLPRKEVTAPLDQALKCDARCVRANLIKGEIAIKAQDWDGAIRFYQKVKLQDLDYITETLEPLRYCYLRRGSGQDEFLDYLYTALSEQANVSICLAIVKLLQEKDREKALQFLIRQLEHQPSLYGLYHLVDLHLEKDAEGVDTGEHLSIVKTLLARLMKNKAIYRCSRCGFSSKNLDWLCPACRTWSTIKPCHV